MGNNLFKSCCTVAHNESRMQGATLTTISSELERTKGGFTQDFCDSMMTKGIHPNKKDQNSINVVSTRKLSDECVQRFNLPDDNINQHYEILDPIGQGKYGKVYLGQSIHDKDKQTAIKIIKIRKIKSNFESVMKEIQMMKSIDHPDIVKILEIYRDPKKLYLVMELVKGEELFDYILRKERLQEEETRKIIRQLVKIVKYLNSVNIAHRDLKPENIMINPKTLKIKLLDFGLSSYFEESKNLVSPVGTPYYVAPEVLRGSYGKECDMWSIGIITYICLIGAPPFQGTSVVDIYQDILNCNLVFNEDDWNQVSEFAMDFVKKLLELNRIRRLSPRRALRHQWFTEEESTLTESRKSRNPGSTSMIDYDQYKLMTFEILKKLVNRGVLKECLKCRIIFEDIANMELLQSSKGLTSKDCKCCCLLKKISPLLELFSDAQIQFNEFLNKVLKNTEDIQPELVSILLTEMEEDKDKENNQLSANMSSSPSRGQVSFEMKSVEDYEEENRPMMITNNTMMNENSYRNKSVLTSGSSKGSFKRRKPLGCVPLSDSKCKELKSLAKQATLSYINLDNQVTHNEGKLPFINSF
ncbi:unnamed protein product [Moneuplotes crassus]|uniref:non-specific serine/threonine protein kinase n=2 Tax=Euplotes crassus TaxID=5936 RepID=A0AAD1U313_EUPCR|nr:unnamed protein product [Moneuplotes crassus]